MRLKQQQGIVLIEALVAALLFMLGVLGLMGVAAKTVTSQSDIEYRTQAASLISQMMDTIWISVNRTSPAAVVTSLTALQHQPDEAAYCKFTGTASTDPAVTPWLDKVNNGANAATRMPGVTTAMQQIQFNAANNNEVTIRLCWQSSADAVPRQHVMRAYIN